MSILKSVIVNVLTALYTPFWFSVVLSVFIMFFIMNAEEHGYKELCKRWVRRFKTEKDFRLTFVLVF